MVKAEKFDFDSLEKTRDMIYAQATKNDLLYNILLGIEVEIIVELYPDLKSLADDLKAVDFYKVFLNFKAKEQTKYSKTSEKYEDFKAIFNGENGMDAFDEEIHYDFILDSQKLEKKLKQIKEFMAKYNKSDLQEFLDDEYGEEFLKEVALVEERFPEAKAFLERDKDDQE